MTLARLKELIEMAAQRASWDADVTISVTVFSDYDESFDRIFADPVELQVNNGYARQPLTRAISG